jgi:hypothetical protein
MRIAQVVLALVMFSASAAWAGDAAGVTPGMLVRVTQPHWKVKGLVLAIDPETLTLAVEGQDLNIRLARSRIVRIEVGQRRSVAAGAARGAGRGLLLGGAAGAVLGAAHGGEGLGGSVLLNVMVVGGFWSMLGGVIGAAHPGESWKRLSTERIRVSVAPHRGGIEASLSASF